MVVDGYALNGSVRLHYLDSNPDGGARKTPIVFVPGMLGSADDYLTETARRRRNSGRGKGKIPLGTPTAHPMSRAGFARRQAGCVAFPRGCREVREVAKPCHDSGLRGFRPRDLET